MNTKLNLSFDLAILGSVTLFLSALLYFIYEWPLFIITAIISFAMHVISTTVICKIPKEKVKELTLYLGPIAYLCYKIFYNDDEKKENKNTDDKEQKISVELKSNAIKWISYIIAFLDGIIFTVIFILNLISWNENGKPHTCLFIIQIF